VAAPEAERERSAFSTEGSALALRPDEMGDDDLLDGFIAGDAAAFGILLTRYQGPLYNFILRSVRDTEAAADLLQELFSRVIERGHEFNKTSKFSTWLYAIARNLCIDHGRRMTHRRHASLDASNGAGGETTGSAWVERIAADAPDAERQVTSRDLRARIAAAVGSLPEEQREVFLMRQLQQLPFAEIALVVGVSENTIKSRMRYALEHLQQALADYAEHARLEA
jgi:RNA polymerase sigma-70 factor (ECF subfamily)